MSEEVTTNEVLAVKLDYISKDISYIKKDIADIKADVITRREFEVHVRDSSDKIVSRFTLADNRIDDILEKANFLSKVLYSVVGLIVTSFVLGILKLVLKQ